LKVDHWLTDMHWQSVVIAGVWKRRGEASHPMLVTSLKQRITRAGVMPKEFNRSASARRQRSPRDTTAGAHSLSGVSASQRDGAAGPVPGPKLATVMLSNHNGLSIALIPSREHANPGGSCRFVPAFLSFVVYPLVVLPVSTIRRLPL
jgi:hypothetical protein